MFHKIPGIQLHALPSFISFTIALFFFTCTPDPVFGQKENSYYPDAKIKKKGGKWGIEAKSEWKTNPRKRDWIIQPTYEKIETAGYMSKYGAGIRYFAWNENKIDVFSQYSLELIIAGISIEDTLYLASFGMFAGSGINPVLQNKLCGWKCRDINIPPQFDSIVLHYDPSRNLYPNEIKVYKNGQLGLMSKEGTYLIPLGDYSDFAPYFPGHTVTYGKPAPSGGLLTGIYFDNKRNIPPIYTSVSLETSITINDTYIGHTNSDLPYFYSCQLPNGGGDYFISKDTGLARLPGALAIAFGERKSKEAMEKKNAVAAEAAKRTWVYSLVLFAEGGAVGMKDSIGKVIFPAQATALEFGRFSIDPDGDTIHVTMVYNGDKELNWAFKGSIPVTNFMSEHEDMAKFAIKAELNPYNSLTGDYKSYFDGAIHAGFDYKAGFALYQGICPLCDGDGKLPDGYSVSSQTFTYDRVVKDGTTTITRKNYLANERIDASGRVYVPTTTQSFDNYKIVKEEKKVVTRTNKYKTCTLCEGRKKYSHAVIVWDDKRNEYVLTTLKF